MYASLYCCKLCRLLTHQLHSEAMLCFHLTWWYMEVHFTVERKFSSILMARQWYLLRAFLMLFVCCMPPTMRCGWSIPRPHFAATNFLSRRYSNRKLPRCHLSWFVCCRHAWSNLVWLVVQTRRTLWLSQTDLTAAILLLLLLLFALL